MLIITFSIFRAHEIEGTSTPILIIGHLGVLRLLYAYFKGLSREDAPHVDLPLNHIIKLQPYAHGCQESRFRFVDDTFERY